MKASRMRILGVICLIFIGYVLHTQTSQCQASAALDSIPASESVASALPLPTAIRFPVIFETPIDSVRVVDGYVLKGSLKEDLSIDEQVIAPAGSSIIGHIAVGFSAPSAPKTLSRLEARLPKHRTIRLLFDEIQTQPGETIKIVGVASPQKKEFVAHGSRREVTVREGGELDKTYRFTGSRRMLLQATDRLREHDGKVIARTFPADVEIGDELYVQAHSPYQK